MLLSLIKKSFKQVVNHNSIVLFLVSYLIITSVVATFAKTNLLMIILGCCLLLLTVVYFSGWFQLASFISKLKDDEVNEKNVFSVFLEGIGKNIVPMIIAFLLYFVALMASLYFSGLIANHIFGDINLVLKDIMAQAADNNNIVQIVSSLPDEQQFILYGWQFCLIIASCILGFLFVTYCPFVIDNDSNMFLRPFKAFFQSIKFTFKNFLSVLGLYSLIYFTYFVLSILRALTEHYMIISVILLFVYIYFMAIVVMLIFNYYEAKNNSSDRPVSVGEDETGDSISAQD